ncbi:MAG: CAP domain-containing protein [bacterium]|nr:CAP domain-containing protein [bacterium]
MFRWLKKHFIPHEGNEHRPHILRDESMRRILVLVIALELVVFIIPSVANLGLSGGMAAVLPAVLGELTNEERQTENLPALAVSPELTLAAQMKAEDMASRGYFAHTSPEGKTPWHWIELAGYKYQYAGENLAVNFRDSKDVTSAWLKSPTHKANIVKANYTEMGTGIARGLYQGRQTVFVAQVYANPMPAVLPSVARIVLAAPIEKKVSSQSEVLGSQITAVPGTPEARPAEGEAPPNGGPREAIAVARVAPEEAVIAEEEIPPVPVQEFNADTKVPENQPLWHKLLASPRNTSNMLMVLVFGVIAAALLIYVVFKMTNHHKDLLGNGLAMLAVVGAFMVANYYLSFSSMAVLPSYDYSLEDTL